MRARLLMFYELLKLKLPVFDVEDDRDAVFSKTALVLLIGGCPFKTSIVFHHVYHPVQERLDNGF